MNKTTLLVLLFGMAALVTPSAQAKLTCTPASPGQPCVTANVPISTDTTSTVAGFTLVANSTKNLALVANYFEGMSYCTSTSETGVFISTDQGSTWMGGCQPPSGTDVGPSLDPIAVYDSHDNLFAGQTGNTTTTEGVFLQELLKTSSTWGNFFPTLTYTNPKTIDFYDYDFPGIAIDSSNCLYVTGWELGRKLSNNAVTSAVTVAHSCNSGSTWATTLVSALQTSPTLATYPRVTVGEDGTVFVTWIQNNDGKTPKVFSSSSTDGGNTWATPTHGLIDITQPAAATCTSTLPIDRALPHTCVRMYYFPQLASTSGPQFNAVYPNYVTANKQIAIYLASGTDAGGSWTTVAPLDSLAADSVTTDPTATGDQFEPCIASASPSSSILGVAWLDTRNSPKGKPDTLYDAYGMFSTDGGTNWSMPYQLSTASSSTTVETEPNSEYLGDWTGCTWQNGIFYYAFPSTANGSHQQAMIAGLNPALP